MLHTLTKWCPILSLGDHAKQLENIPPVHTEILYLRSRWKGRRAGSPGWCCAGWPGSRKCSRTATHPSDPGGREAAARRPAAPAQPRYGGPGDPGNGRDETMAPRRRQAGRWGRGKGYTHTGTDGSALPCRRHRTHGSILGRRQTTAAAVDDRCGGVGGCNRRSDGDARG